MPTRNRGAGSRSRPQPLAARLQTRLNWHLTNGPIARDVTLPYGLGVKLLPAWLRLSAVHAPQRPAKIARFRAILAHTGQTDPTGQKLWLHLLANSWRLWRDHCLRDPVVQQQWVTVEGLEHVKAAYQDKRPVVFVFVHTAVHTHPALQIAAQMTGPIVRFTPLKPGDAQTQTAESVVKLRHIHAHLANGGAVAIEGDGYSGQRDRPVTFLGKPFALPFGFAHLAAHHRAALVPLATQLAPTGHVHFTYYPAFETSATSLRGRGMALFEQFLAFFQAQWPETVPQMKNEVLRFFLPSLT